MFLNLTFFQVQSSLSGYSLFAQESGSIFLKPPQQGQMANCIA